MSRSGEQPRAGNHRPSARYNTPDVETKPARSWYGPRNVLLAAAGVLAFVIGREIWLALTAEPGRRINYASQLADLIESHQPVPADSPDARDGWGTLLRAIEIQNTARQLVFDADPKRRAVTLDFSIIGPPPPNSYRDAQGRPLIQYGAPETWEDVEQQTRIGVRVLREQGLFHLTAELAASNRGAHAIIPDERGRLIGMLLPYLSPMRQIARVQKARMVIAADQGDWAEFARAFDEAMALGRVASHQGVLIDDLVGVAIQALACAVTREMLTEYTVADAAALRAILQSLDRQALAPRSLPLNAERISLNDTIQWSHSDNGRGSGRLIWSEVQWVLALSNATSTPTPGWLKSLGGSRLANISGMFFASKAQTQRKADEYFEIMSAQAERPAYRRASVGEGLIEALSPRYLLLKSMLPGMTQWLRSHDQHDCLLAGTRALVAIELFHAEHGRYPDSLDELVPAVLSRPPIDPINGEPFAYKRLVPGADPLGRTFILYSLGADGQDNDARRAERNTPNAAMRLPEGLGLDYVLNEPRYVPEDYPPVHEPDAGPGLDPEPDRGELDTEPPQPPTETAEEEAPPFNR